MGLSFLSLEYVMLFPLAESTRRIQINRHSGGDTPSAPRQRERAQIPDHEKWDLSAIYADDGAWQRQKERLKDDLQAIDRFRGILGKSPGTLLACLELTTGLAKEYARLYCYASMRSDEDTRDSACLGMEQEISQLGSDFSARTAFVQPEVLQIGRQTIDAWIAGEPRLNVHRHGLDDILRRKDHTGTEGEERILANAGLVADAPHSIYSVFTNADFPFPEVELSDGNRVRLDQSAFSLYRTIPNRKDRQKVFAAYFTRLGEYSRTFGTQLAAEVKKNIFFTRSRKYDSSLRRALDGGNIPPAVYHGLIENVHAGLGTFHRYLDLRKRLLRLEQLHYYDLYAPVLPDLDARYSYDEACGLVLDSLSPLGTDYCAVARKALTERWVDVHPTTGKRSGAYSNGGVYDVHPYILLNYNGKYDDVSTLAHELGHTMHSYLTNTIQPYATSDYSIFVAEVASTFNESLLMDSMFRKMTDDAERLSLLAHELDGIRGTVFRQTQFAEFEWRIHERAERGESLTGEVLGDMYERLCRTYYGHDNGVCIVDPEIRHEWAQIPHFYYSFYVYQYATSFTASTALSEMILGGDTVAVKRYLDLLSAGGSDYPINLLRRAGVDMTSARPFELTMRRMNRVMDEMEAILTKKGF
jgi:oligoendopeptidase F